MRVSIVMPSASPTGGAEEAFCQLLKSDAAKTLSWQAMFLEPGPLVEIVAQWVDRTTVIPSGRTREVWKWWYAVDQIVARTKAFDTDLMLSWMTKGHVYGGLAAWRLGIPAVWYQMGLPDYGFLERASRQIPSSAILACSEFVAEEQRKAQPGANVASIPLGVDLKRFSPELLPSPRSAREQLNLPVEGPIVGIVGRLQRWKGMHVLLDAMPDVLSNYPTTHCVVVGGPYPAEPEYQSELFDQAARLGITDQVTFAGARNNVPVWMQAMDVFVHASFREPFGIVVVEALALGKPVIACAPGGPSQIFGSEAVGTLVPFEDSKQLSNAICKNIEQGEAASSNQTIARKFSHETFSTDVVDFLHEHAGSASLA